MDSSKNELTQAQSACLEILSIYKKSIDETDYNQIKDTIVSSKGMELLLTFQLDDWKMSLCNNVAGIAMHRQFKNVESTYKLSIVKSKKNEEKEKDESYTNCNDNVRVYQASLPINWDKSKGRNNNKPLHLKMNWKIDVSHIMYHLEFRGHLYVSSQIIYSIAVGYIDSKTKQLKRTNVIHLGKGLQQIEQYISKDNHVCFKLVSQNNQDWHASDLIVNFIGATDWYHRNGVNKGVTVIEAVNSDEKF